MAGRKKSHSEQWWATAPASVRRCHAGLKSGGQCKRRADLGSVVCEQHGALAPQVQRRAKERLILHADRVVEMMLGLIDDPDVPMHLRIKLMEDWLDRAGVDKSQTVTIGTDPIEHLLRQLMDAPGALDAEVEQGDVLELEDAIYDAEVIENDPLDDAFDDVQRVVDPPPTPRDYGTAATVPDPEVVQPMPPWMAQSYGNHV